MNITILIGRLTKTPEVRYGGQDNQTAIARFTLAVDRSYKKDGKNETDFINCVAFGKVGELVEKYLDKGSKIAVQGRWQVSTYKNNDKTYYNNDCVVDTVEFLDTKKKDNDGFTPSEDVSEDNLPFV